jgi:hypothetical protein
MPTLPIPTLVLVPQITEMVTKAVVGMKHIVSGGWTLTGWAKQAAGLGAQVIAGRALQTPVLVLVTMMPMAMMIPGIGRTGPNVEKIWMATTTMIILAGVVKEMVLAWPVVLRSLVKRQH